MSISKLASGRWRAQVWDKRVGRNVSVGSIIGGPGSFPTKREAKAARERARAALGQAPEAGEVTVATFWDRWTTDPLFQRPKASTNAHNRERTRAFCARYGTVPLALITDQTVAEWLAGGKNLGTVPALRAMFNDAASAKAGRLIERNPFAGLGIKRSAGRRYQRPPDEQLVRDLIANARKLTNPSFAAFVQVAAYTGMRPGELDALRWNRVDFDGGWIHVVEQYSSTAREFTTPKNGRSRSVVLTPPARDALLSLPRDQEFCFTNLRGEHWTGPGRAYHWKAVKAAAGYDGELYLATRHFAGWYMRNELKLDSEDVAIMLGHTDGGQLVRTLYGHLEDDRSLQRVRDAYEQRSNVVPLRKIDGGAA
ncbi:MAG: site-specific integrase [Solirubrobacterales bacterium]|nr:site-specific integrase [Solirubrobacterales bacterium]